MLLAIWFSTILEFAEGPNIVTAFRGMVAANKGQAGDGQFNCVSFQYLVPLTVA